MAGNRAGRAPGAVALTEAPGNVRAALSLAGRWARSPRSLTFTALAVALLIRMWLIAQSHGMMDSDEAALGIQAENILRGHFPVYFPGQNYMGSWDAYLMAPLVYIFGPTALAPRIVTLAEYLIYLALMGMLAARLYGERARAVALLFTALPPLYVTITELRMLGGYIETLTIGAALLLLSLEIRQRWRDGRPAVWQWALIGGLIGLGLWIDTLTAEYVIVCTLWLAPDAYRRMRAALTGAGWLASVRAALPTACVALVAGAICASPLLLSPQTYQGGNPALPGQGYMHALTVPGARIPALMPPPDIWTQRGYLLLVFVYQAVPNVIGSSLTYPPLSAWTLPALAIGALAAELLLIAIIITWRATRWSLRHPLSSWPQTQGDEQWSATLPFILGAVTLGAYLGSKLLSPPNALSDQSRYILPLTTACTLALAYALAWLSRQARIRVAKSSANTLARPQRIALRGAPLAALLLGLLLILYALPYVLSNPIIAFDSPYNQFGIHQNRVIPADAFPAQDIALLDYLEASHIHAVWANQWVGDVVMYLSDQRIQSADYISTHDVTGYNRFPEAYRMVAAADRPSYIVAWDGAGPTPLAVALDGLGVRYHSAQFGRYWVITPLSRAVAPAEIIPALIKTYW